MAGVIPGDVAPCTAHQVGEGLAIRLLALELEASGGESYHVSFSPGPGVAFRSGVMTHADGRSWHVVEADSGARTSLVFRSPDAVFRLAVGDDAPSSGVSMMTSAAPHWPTPIAERLASRRLSGAGIVAFDARWFLSRLTTSAMDRPLILLDAASKLGLGGLERASAIVQGITAAAAVGGNPDHLLVDALARALTSAGVADGRRWDGEGRLIGEYASGELAQRGTDIGQGCRAAVGAGPLRVVFKPAESLGLGLGPSLFAEDSTSLGDQGDRGSVGTGAEVGEVEARGAADRAGVTVGMVLSRLSEPDLDLLAEARSGPRFEAVLSEIDARRARGHELVVTFDTAAPMTHLYAVEMDAAAALAALAAAQGRVDGTQVTDVGVGASFDLLCGSALLWREDTPRLFIGEAGSITCAHTDICPQLQLAHGLLGLKFLSVASHQATPRLSTDHAEAASAGGAGATHVPTDRPLSVRQSRLISDAELSTAVLQAGDLAVFDSGALHFASNGAEGLSCALYHGLITPAAVPRLRVAAALRRGSCSGAEVEYRGHLFAADLLRMVERPLMRFNRAAAREATGRADGL